MKNKRTFLKRTLSLLMAAVMTVGISPLSEFAGLELSELFSVKTNAADGECNEEESKDTYVPEEPPTLDLPDKDKEYEYYTEGNYTYFVTSSGAYISDVNSEISGDIIIPSTFSDENIVVGIYNNAFSDCTKITGIVIPNSIKYISKYAFSGCTGLKKLTIPGNVVEIGMYAFYNCKNLTEVIILQESVEYSKDFGQGIFLGCNNLTSITLPSARIWTLRKYADYYPENLKFTLYGFLGCTSLKTLYYGGSEDEWNGITYLSLGEDIPVVNPDDPEQPAPTLPSLTTPAIPVIYYNYKSEYSVTFNANGGSVSPVSVTVENGKTTTMPAPTKNYKITYNANGGSVLSSSKTVNCTFKNWNTNSAGTGTAYKAGANYTVKADATLYAQWTNPTYGTLPTPTRTDYTFSGWYTSATGGTKVTSSSTVSADTILYAQWEKAEDIYNLGEETYSFDNFTDFHGEEFKLGHCFGMSMTSAAYHLGILDITNVGGNKTEDVYALSNTSDVTEPICYYQDNQDDNSIYSNVAGGTYYLNVYHFYKRSYDIKTDWKEVIDYVKNHNYDNKGNLQIGFRKDGEGGHAINFLRYEVVNGQERIYAYDNNFPNTETYFYMDSNGKVYQAPYGTFSGAIDCIALRSVEAYFNLVGDFDSTRCIYANRDSINVIGAAVCAIDGGVEMGERVVFKVPDNVNQVTIIPLEDNAEFSYLDNTYSFGNVEDDCIGKLALSSLSEDDNSQLSKFSVVPMTDLIISAPTQTSYTYKTNTSTDGLKVIAKYSDNSEIDVTDKVNITNFDTTEKGDRTATVEFEGKTATFDYSVSYAWWQWIIIIVLFGWIWY